MKKVVLQIDLNDDYSEAITTDDLIIAEKGTIFIQKSYKELTESEKETITCEIPDNYYYFFNTKDKTNRLAFIETDSNINKYFKEK